MVLFGDESNTTHSQEENAAPEPIMSGGAAPGGALKAPPEAMMSHEEVAVNMNPSRIHFEIPQHDDTMNMGETPLD
jgi:hypothetical protein